jgi:hypothetical protein
MGDVGLRWGSLSAERAIYVWHLVRSPIGMILGLGLLLAFAATAVGQTPTTYDDVNTPEGWAWSQIKQGLPADFGDHCGVGLDPTAQDDARWRDDPCRTIPASFIVDLLTKSSLHNTIPYKGVVISNAKVVGDVDLQLAAIDRPLRIGLSRFEGAMRLDYAHADDLLDFERSFFTGPLEAIGFRSESNLELRGATIFGKVRLGSAKIKGHVGMIGAKFKDDLEADALEVGGWLEMESVGSDKATFKNVSITRARVAGQVKMVGSSFDGYLDAEGLRVGDALWMYSDARNRATFQAVNLLDGEVASNVELIGATVAGRLEAGSLKVGGSLMMRSEGTNEANFKEVDLTGTKVARNLELNGARFDGDVIAESVQIGGSLIAAPSERYKTRFERVNFALSAVNGQVNMVGSIFGGNVTLTHFALL